jgi:formylglycine-generating enzyme required for sulfatase activity
MLLITGYVFHRRCRWLWALSAAVLALLAVGCGSLGGPQAAVAPAAPIEVDVISSTTRTRDDMVMVYVPAGTFTMGRVLGPEDQLPAHEVTLDAFWIDQTEVTNAQYGRCVAADECEKAEFTRKRDFNGDAYPVVGVSWFDATAYCAWVGGRLPTEAEWEYAARGPENLLYPWGDEPQEDYANCSQDDCADGFEFTAPVGSFPQGVNWVGAVDMAGNVWEWVNDWYRAGYYGVSPNENPPGPSTGGAKVLRGGAWDYNWANLRATSRQVGSRGYRNIYFGFRCAGDAPVP